MTLLDEPQRIAIRAILVEEVQATPRRARPVRVIRRVGVGALAAGTLAAALVIVNLTAPHAAAPADAAVLLRAAAVSTISTSDPTVGPDQYLRVTISAAYLALTTTGSDDSYVGYVSPELDVVYYRADASAPVLTSSTPQKPSVFFGAAGKAMAEQDWNEHLASNGTPPPNNGELGGGTRAPEDVATLPRDPADLLAYLRGYHFEAAPSDSNVFDHVVSLLRDGRAPADLRATLYRVLARIPAVQVTAQQAVLDGRTGTAFGLAATATSARQDIIIDTATGVYLGERQVLTSRLGAVPAGTPMEWTAVTLSVVDALP